MKVNKKTLTWIWNNDLLNDKGKDRLINMFIEGEPVDYKEIRQKALSENDKKVKK